MGVGSTRRAAAKTKDKATNASTPVRARRAAKKGPKPGDSPVTTPQSSSKKSTGFTSKLPTDEQRRSNGRHSGRNLINWSRPRMAEKLLLHVQYECSRHRIQVPWDEIAHRLHPGSSGQAVVQHINRLRKDVAVEGHLVPPAPVRPTLGRTQDNKIRGYVRDEAADEPNAMRPVYFDEHIEDRKLPIPGAFVEDYEDDDAEQNATAGTPDHDIKNESPRSPTPGERQRFTVRASGRKMSMERSPYGHKSNAGDAFPYPPTFNSNSILDKDILGVDPALYSPETTRVLGYPQSVNGSMFGSSAFSYPLNYYHSTPMSAEQLRHPAFTQGGDPFFGVGQGSELGFGSRGMQNTLFSMPHVPEIQKKSDANPAAIENPTQRQDGCAVTISSSGTQSQSSGNSFEDHMDNKAKSAGQSFGSCTTSEVVDNDQVPKSA